MNTLLASILDCISPVAKSASLVAVAVTRIGDNIFLSSWFPISTPRQHPRLFFPHTFTLQTRTTSRDSQIVFAAN